MGIKGIGVLFLVYIFIFTGCGRTTGNKEEAQSFAVDAENVETEFAAEYWETQVTPDYTLLSTSFLLTEEALYFVDNTAERAQKICKVSLEHKEPPVELILKK